MSRAILQKIALERGGRCLSERYINSKTKYEWECLAGHRWFAPFDKVKHRNQWCPVCYKNRSFEKLRSIVEERGGKVLSEGMDTVRSTLSVLCNQGHQFSISYRQLVEGGKWCSQCDTENITAAIMKDCEQRAAEMGGRCVKHLSGNSRKKASC